MYEERRARLYDYRVRRPFMPSAIPAFETITGYTREEVLGKNPRLLKSGTQNDEFYEELWATISSGSTWKGRIVNRRKDDSLYTEEATISPVFDPCRQCP